MRVRICDLRTGRRILDLPYLRAEWTGCFNTAESVSATVSLADRRIQRLDLYNASIPGRTALIIEDEGVTNGGPIWTRRYERDRGTLELDAKGMWSYFEHRTLLPPMRDSDRLTNPDGTAATAFDTSLEHTSYQAIAKTWVAHALAWRDADLPIVFEGDRPGDRQRTVKGAELKLVADMLTNLTQVRDGPDIRFAPHLSGDGLGYQWLMKMGDPRLGGNSATVWDTTLPGQGISSLSVVQDADDLAGMVWETGGAASDQAIIERAIDHEPALKGFPLFERVESLSSSVTDPATALEHARESIRTSTRPQHTWQFSVQRDRRLGEYDVGSPCTLITGHDPFGIPDGRHDLRIMSLHGSSDSDRIDITTGAFHE